MSIEIVEVDIEEVRRTSLLTRAKSPKVRAIYEAMFSLKPGEAKAVIVESGEDISQIRNMITQCAVRASMDLQIVVDRIGGRVLFTEKPEDASDDSSKSFVSSSRSPEEQAAQIDRRDRIRKAAIALGKERPQISAQEVVDHLRDNGEQLDLPRPTTAVSAVMRNMAEFEHIDRSRFTYLG